MATEIEKLEELRHALCDSLLYDPLLIDSNFWLIKNGKSGRDALRTKPLAGGSVANSYYCVLLRIRESANSIEPFLLLIIRGNSGITNNLSLRVAGDTYSRELIEIESTRIESAEDIVHNGYSSLIWYYISYKDLISFYSNKATIVLEYNESKTIVQSTNEEDLLQLLSLKYDWQPSSLNNDEIICLNNLLNELNRKKIEEESRKNAIELEKEKKAREEQERIRGDAIELAQVLLKKYESYADNCENWSEDDFQRWINENSWMSSNAIQECINRFSYSYFIQLLGILKQKRVVSKYEVLSGISNLEDDRIVVKINSYLFDRVSYAQLNDLIDERTTFGQIVQISPIKPCIIKVKTLINNKSSQNSINDSGAQSSNSRKVENNQGCYIATCVYGSYDCPEVWTLRRYRDQVLKSTWVGRVFIRAYYTFSPILVRRYGDRILCQKCIRETLDNWVRDLNRRGFKNTAYFDFDGDGHDVKSR